MCVNADSDILVLPLGPIPQNQYPSVSPWLGTFGDEGPSGPPSWVERLPLDHGAKTLPELTAPVWDRASATSRLPHGRGFCECYTEVDWRAASLARFESNG